MYSKFTGQLLSPKSIYTVSTGRVLILDPAGKSEWS